MVIILLEQLIVVNILLFFLAPGYFSDTLNVGLQNGVLTVLNDTLVSMTPISVGGQVLDDLGH